MRDRAIVSINKADYAAGELAAISATLAGCDPGQACSAVTVLVIHPEPGIHEMKLLTDGVHGAPQVAALLRHVAAHCDGGCRPCRRRNRRARRDGGQ